jgi:hypothetical protein
MAKPMSRKEAWRRFAPALILLPLVGIGHLWMDWSDHGRIEGATIFSVLIVQSFAFGLIYWQVRRISTKPPLPTKVDRLPVSADSWENEVEEQPPLPTSLDVFSRGVLIGHLEKPMPDMWYLEGRWVGEDTAAAREFESVVATIDVRDALRDPSLGRRIEIADPGSTQRTHAVALSLGDGMLMMRRVFDRAAIRWMLDNVKE